MAFYQSEGTVPQSNETWNIMEIAGAMTWMSSFKTIGLRESGITTFFFNVFPWIQPSYSIVGSEVWLIQPNSALYA